MPARRELSMRTVFNLLGPLTNPAGASAQVVGVYAESLYGAAWRARSASWACAARSSCTAPTAWTKFRIAGETCVAELRDGVVRSYTVTPEDFGLHRAPLEADSRRRREAKRRDHSQNSRPLAALPRTRAASRIVLANASAALVAAGRAADFLDGVRIAAESIDSGAALARLEALIAFSQAEKTHSQSAP